ncbi:MAG: B12-binding domain-containing radical SAM protein [Rhodoferax sp.]
MTAPIVLATLNARYIHASLGLRYLRANLARHGGEDLYQACALREFTLQSPLPEVADALLQALGDAPGAILGLGVYIWNVGQTHALLQLLRQRRPQLTVVLGGPEVSHELDTQPIVALADYVITGWGDLSFAHLCRALADGRRPPGKVIAGEQPPLEQIALPYGEFSDQDLAQRVVYVEASRGCPFRCEFCLSSLDKSAWSFESDRVLQALDALWQRGARNFKFVDRTFNLKLAHCQRILHYFLQRIACVEEGGTLPLVHFEVIPDHLPAGLQELLAQFPPGSLQLEVGVQSFNPVVQQRIARRQDNARTEAHLRWLVQHTQAHIHADLIFGLPGEDWDSFAQGFDRLWALGVQEIQLGLLKRLRGTPIARHSAEWAMDYDPQPPYSLRSNRLLSSATVQRFGRIAHHWDQVANSGRLRRTVPLLLGAQPFAQWCAFSDWMHARDPRPSGITPEQWVDALHGYLVGTQGLAEEAVRAVLLADYAGSGARGQPQCLRGWLERRAPQARARRLAQRQDRHQGDAAPQHGLSRVPGLQ